MTQTNAASKRQIAAEQKVKERDDFVERNIIHLIMVNPEGRRWMWNQLSACHVFRGDDNLDPYWMAWQKGLRNYGLRLLRAVMTYEPSLYVDMTKESSMVAAKELHDGGSANDSDDDLDA